MVARQRSRQPPGRHGPGRAAGRCRCSATPTSPSSRWPPAPSIGLRVVVVVLVFAVYSACVDPDRVLRALRPVARRSALTAALVTRLVPLAAADGAGCARQRRCAGPAAEPVGARPWPAGWSRARWTAPSTSRRRSSCAATRCRCGREPAASRSRDDRAAARCAAPRSCSPGRWPRLVAGAGGFETYPRIEMATDAVDARACCAAAARRSRRSLRAAEAGGACLSRSLALRAALLPLPGGAPTRCAGVDLRVEPGEFVVLGGPLGVRQVDAAARRLRPGPALPRRARSRASSRSRGWTSARTARPSSPPSVGLVAQEPETQVVSTTVRAEIELPLELRGRRAGGAGPRGRGGGAGAGDRRAARANHRHALGRRAAARRPRRRARDPARAWCCSTSRPRSSTPSPGDELISLLRRLNEEWGVAVLLGEHRLERCLAAADRVVALGRRVASPSTARPGSSSNGRWTPIPRSATPAPRCSRAGLPAPASVREAAPRRSAGRRPHAEDVPQPALERAPDVAAGGDATALAVRDLWVELGEGEERTEALRGVDLEIDAGERVALMGRNGAGKSTLLRAAAGLVEPQRGRVDAPRGVALLPQRPGDLLRSRAGRGRAPRRGGRRGAAALRARGPGGRRSPRPLRRRAPAPRAGDRRRGPGPGAGEPPGALLLDEPTRGMDRARKAELAELAPMVSPTRAPPW